MGSTRAGPAGDAKAPQAALRRWFLTDLGGPRQRTQLLCLPHAGGGASSYREWLAPLAGHVDVVPVQLPGRENRTREPAVAQMPDLIADLVRAIRWAGFDRVALFGHSLGAIIAAKLCEALEDARVEVAHVFVSGHPGPGQVPHGRTLRMAAADDTVLHESLADLDAAAVARLSDPELREIAFSVIRADLRLATTGRFGGERFAAPVTVLGGTRDPLLAGQDLSRWGALSRGDCAVYRIPGDHFYLATERSAVARIVRERLTRRPVPRRDHVEATDVDITYDPYDPLVHEQPYETYAALRERFPVYYNADLDIWVLSRHADVSAALRDSKRFSNANGILIEPSAWSANAHLFQSLLGLDPPRHTQVRALVAAPFGRHRVPGLEPLIRRSARNALDMLLARDTFDFAAEFAGRFPADVLCALIGVPGVDREHVAGLAQRAARHDELSRDIPLANFEAAGRLAGYYRALVTARRARRRDDLVSELLDAEIAGVRFTDDEIVSFLHALTGAANDTVVHLLSSAWFWAWRCPGQGRTALAGDIGPWIEETLRYDTPTQFVARTVAEPVELHGTRIPAGARALLLIGAANRDPAVFPSPEAYDLSRDTTRKLSFGRGRHLCLGAAVARLEARVALEELTARIADYEIRVAGMRRAPAAEIRGFANLPTIVTRRH